jgi:hypothetical protein
VSFGDSCGGESVHSCADHLKGTFYRNNEATIGTFTLNAGYNHLTLNYALNLTNIIIVTVNGLVMDLSYVSPQPGIYSTF